MREKIIDGINSIKLYLQNKNQKKNIIKIIKIEFRYNDILIVKINLYI